MNLFFLKILLKLNLQKMILIYNHTHYNNKHEYLILLLNYLLNHICEVQFHQLTYYLLKQNHVQILKYFFYVYYLYNI